MSGYASAQLSLLAAAPWWATHETQIVLAGLAFLCVTALAWIALLRARVREATEQIRQQLAREAALEQRYEEFIECAQDLIFSLDFQGNFTACNRACERVLGYAREELWQRNLVELAVPEQAEQIKRRIKGTTSLDTASTFDMAILTRAGQRVELEVNARVIRQDGLLGIQAIARDVTDRKRAEQAVRRSEELFKQFMRNNPAISFLKDAEGRYVYANRAWETQFTEPRTDWLDQTDYDFWPVDTAKIFRESDRAALTGTGTLERMETAHAPDGELRYWMTFKFPVVDALGRQLVGGMNLDVTDRYRAEEALRQSEALFSKAFHASPIAIAITTAKEHRIIDVNHGFGQLLGYQRADLIGRRSLELGLWVNLEQHARLIETLQHGGLVRGVECQLRGNTGEIHTAVVSLELTELGAEPCLLFIAHDITEHLKLEDQLRRAQKMEAVGQLAAGIAHDFNNILTVIQGSADLLRTPQTSASAAGDLVEHIAQAAARAASLTRQLLMFSRKQIIQPRPLDLNQLIGDLSKMLGRVIGENIELQLSFQAGLPAVFADPGMVEQVVLNIAVNARDAMPDGGRLTFSTAAMEFDEASARKNADARPGKFVCLRITDTGCGMDLKTRQRIFEPFFTTKEVGKGTGLGLATVYGIVKQHQGWIDVQSQPGLGTTFLVFLPEHAGQQKPTRNASSGTSVRGGNETILVVEDEPALCGLVETILLRCGYQVLTAADGVEALALWPQHRDRIDLLLTDMIMPNGVSGRDLATQVQSDRPDLKIIFTSGYSAEMLGNNFVLEPGTHFLQKPYEPALLAKAVRNCLDADDERTGEPTPAPLPATLGPL
ncbi:MAG: PAS domain S-box protein [Verrucomicrobia bacterium]|nr:PAS domain S-box protein [Verrucomicrobiota bacterium]